MAEPRIRVHVPVNLLAETFAVLTTHGLEEKAELIVTPPLVQLAGAAALGGDSNATFCDHGGPQEGEATTVEEETTVVNEKRQLAAHPSNSSTVDLAPSGTGTEFYSLADGDGSEWPQHQPLGFAHHENWEEDYSDGQTECFDPGGGDGELAGHNLDEQQWYHDVNSDSTAGTSDRADIAATHTAANGGAWSALTHPACRG